MAIELSTPDVASLGTVIAALRDWQHDGEPVQLHPGDVGWYLRFGADRTAAALRTWRSDGGGLLAVGLLDGPTVLRMAVAPEVQQDEELARRIAEDASAPDRGVLDDEDVYVASPSGSRLQEVLYEIGWTAYLPWTPLTRDLSEPVPEAGVRIETTTADRVADRVAVQRAAFDGSTFTGERWRDMAAGQPFSDARDLVAYDDRGSAVAAVTVWSAGPGRPGLIEPMGVHKDHRGHGHGTAVTVAAAAALRELGSSSVLVCTPSSNSAGIATYRAAGFEELPEIPDQCLSRPGAGPA